MIVSGTMTGPAWSTVSWTVAGTSPSIIRSSSNASWKNVTLAPISGSHIPAASSAGLLAL
ncbi:hypothetical protein [Nannocystis pusilla]|uniref:hypothetical protein n=1 Tax=Nannocystis pusilla TaxID=889268 RepID=UPI003B80E40C